MVVRLKRGAGFLPINVISGTHQPMTLRTWLRAIPLIFIGLAPLTCCAAKVRDSATPLAAQTLTGQQKLFQKTREQMERNEWTQAKQNMALLRHYPLYPYLELALLTEKIDSLPRAEIDDFLQRYPDSVVSDRLRNQWLAALTRNGRWADFLSEYRAEDAGKNQRCWHAEALFQTGDPEQSLAETEQLWLTADRPDACDAPFTRWLGSERRSEALIWKRFMLALEQKQDALAAALASEIREPYKLQANYALALYRDPVGLGNLLPQIVQQPQAGQVISLTLKNLARHAPDMAAGLWRQTTAAKQLSAEESAAARTEIGRQIIVARGQDALPWLLQNDPEGADGLLLEWRIRLSLRGGDWPQLANWIERLPPDLAQSPRWQYWHARALAQQADDPAKQQQANDIFAGLARERGYYGFLSADRIKAEYALNDRPVQTSVPLASIEMRPDIRRAREFLALNEKTNARREWQRALSAMKTEEQQAAAQLAQRWGWHDEAIRSAMKSGAMDDLELRFPLAYREPMTGAARSAVLPPQWLYAIARQESAFMSDAKSPAGALGLLQLMPGTAQQVAKGLKLNLKQDQLLQPGSSIQLGSVYLSDLLRRFDGNRVLATAAYNAGPRRISDVLKNQAGQLSADVWIETLPYRETREYVQNVLSFAVIYAQRLGQPGGLLAANETAIGQPALQVGSSDAPAETAR